MQKNAPHNLQKEAFRRDTKIHFPQLFLSSSSEKRSVTLFFITSLVFARINTHHTYTLRSGEQPRIKKKSPREEDICVHK